MGSKEEMKKLKKFQQVINRRCLKNSAKLYKQLVDTSFPSESNKHRILMYKENKCALSIDIYGSLRAGIEPGLCVTSWNSYLLS